MNNLQPCVDILGTDRCTGCFGCQTACPRDAIRLVLDAEGFYKPVVNRAVCTHCGFCQRRCPVLDSDAGQRLSTKWTEPKTFAAWSLDDSLRLASSSGGLFSELARTVIEQEGTVAGCIWGSDWTPQHVLARTWSDVEKMRGSKYVPSRVGTVYAQVVQHLRSHSGPVLFVGTPCQVAAMELALTQEQRKRVLLVDLICHGVPSLRVFHRYLRELFDGEKVSSYLFREKSFGWIDYSVCAESAGHHYHHVLQMRDPFFAGFCEHSLYVMTSCHACEFARLPRAGDITIGDFWGCPEPWNDKRGVSVALANTAVGLRALEELKRSSRIALEPADIATAVKGNPRLVVGEFPMPMNRRAFLDGIILGKRFSSLKVKYFPKVSPKWRVWWSFFYSNDAKLEYVFSAVLRKLQKICQKRV
jgi:coenzyme F420-reducing hydrogenase beta subunit